MRKAIVFINGDLADLSRVRNLITKDTLLVGCDGGAAHILSLGLTPHVVIGDFDSLSPKNRRLLKKLGVELIRYPRDKLYTDSELGVDLAAKRGCREIIITGVRGTSTDHLVGNLFMLAKKKFAHLSLRIIEGNEEIVLVRKYVRINGKKGDIVSLIPARGDARGITTRGLFYSLKDATIKAGSSRALRNSLTGKRAVVSLRGGALLVVHQRT